MGSSKVSINNALIAIHISALSLLKFGTAIPRISVYIPTLSFHVIFPCASSEE